MFVAFAAVLVLQKPNVLTADERAAGWRLLFDGKSTRGWHNFRAEGVRPGWKVADGVLSCVDPHDAGDIVTDERFDWFEMVLDYRLAEGANSGVMFHVADTGDTAWQSGPEIQLHDRVESSEPQKSGWLYALYPGRADVAKPGEWNHLRILITPKVCGTELNGVPLTFFTLGSDDFKARVSRSKFGSMPGFAMTEKGSLALQGDHGVVSFRNVKIRPYRG